MVVLRARDGEFSFATVNHHVRLRWQADKGHWNAVSLTRLEAVDLAGQLLSLAEAVPAGTLYCSFCGQSQHEVKKLFAGPGANICDGCSAITQEIVQSEGASK